MIIPVITNNQLPSYETPASAGMDIRATFEHIVEKFLFNTISFKFIIWMHIDTPLNIRKSILPNLIK